MGWGVGGQRGRALTHIFLYSEVLLSQKTRPDARLSLKLPQPRLPVKTLLGGGGGGGGGEKGEREATVRRCATTLGSAKLKGVRQR